MSRHIAITLGDPCGVGPELALKILATEKLPSEVTVTLFGSPNLLENKARSLDMPLFWQDPDHPVAVVGCGPDPEDGVFPREDEPLRAESVLAALDHAIDACRRGECQALVTGPLDKSVVRTLLPEFQGHTGYLQARAQSPQTVMLMDNREIRVALVTDHIPLAEVPETLTPKLLESVILATAQGFTRHFGVAKPRLALAALNPHGGETSSRPEEKTVFLPVLKKLARKGLSVDGPYAGDTLFSLARSGKWDAVISPYHDQGLVAVKYNGFEHVVNITLGLPFLRTSPGHGVAYDQVGKTSLDVRSFRRAFNIAITGRLDT